MAEGKSVVTWDQELTEMGARELLGVMEMCLDHSGG